MEKNVKMVTHKVYTEILDIEWAKEFNGHFACEDTNHLQDGEVQNVKLTTDDEKVDCHECLEFMGKQK